MNNYTTEEQRLRSVYARRDALGKPLLYSCHRQEVLLNAYRFRSVAASLFKAEGLYDLSQLEVLDVGCGGGDWLHTLLQWGASTPRLHGIDLLPDRIESARKINPGIDFRTASGYSIPFQDNSMNLVSALTVFSSILDHSARKALAQELIRVLQPAGRIFIYDFRISDPRNTDTIGISKAEIKRLFSGFLLRSCSLTLAPPIARRIGPASPLLAQALEVCFPFLRTHTCHMLKNGSAP